MYKNGKETAQKGETIHKRMQNLREHKLENKHPKQGNIRENIIKDIKSSN